MSEGLLGLAATSQSTSESSLEWATRQQVEPMLQLRASCQQSLPKLILDHLFLIALVKSLKTIEFQNSRFNSRLCILVHEVESEKGAMNLNMSLTLKTCIHTFRSDVRYSAFANRLIASA